MHITETYEDSMMFNITKTQRKLIADIGIGFGILILAWMLKDADSEGKTHGIMTIFAAVLIYISGSKFLGSKDSKCKKEEQ